MRKHGPTEVNVIPIAMFYIYPPIYLVNFCPYIWTPLIASCLVSHVEQLYTPPVLATSTIFCIITCNPQQIQDSLTPTQMQSNKT